MPFREIFSILIHVQSLDISINNMEHRLWYIQYDLNLGIVFYKLLKKVPDVKITETLKSLLYLGSTLWNALLIPVKSLNISINNM